NATEDNLDKETAELELSASAIHRELHLRAARLKRRRNSSKRIYQLPEEVFAEILAIDVLDFVLEEEERFFHPMPRMTLPAVRRARLCNVSHRFLQTVMTTPRIWSDICWGRDDYLRLLQMSAQAPLTIRCFQYDPIITRTSGEKGDFLNAVWGHSERWKALSLDLRLDDRYLPSPEFPAPQLRDFNVKFDHFSWDSPEIAPYVFKISGNPSLRNLSLTKAGLQWDGIDLSHLKSLSLNSIEQGAPSLEKLVETLRMASCLETLSLRQVNTVSLDEEQQLELQPIHLNALITLYIAEMPTGLADYLVTIIRTPQLKTSHVHGLLLKHLENPDSDQNPYHHFFRVIIPTLAVRGSINLALCNDIFSEVVSLEPDSQFIWTPRRSADTAIGTASFGVEAESPVQGVEAMVEFLTSYRIDCLTVMASGRKLPTPPDEDQPPPSGSYFPAEVLGKLPMVTKISVGVLDDALNILNFLGSPRRDEGTGRFGWACPQLEELELEGIRGLTPNHIQAFVDAREGDGNPLIIEGQVVQRPQWAHIRNQQYLGTLPVLPVELDDL
ncbi:hypothetical protein FRC00_003762, partial [Tulasnella sp. 408]